MKMTLLEMTQSILSAMDSDEVDSIDDTVESLQVATNIKEAYFDLIGQRDWPFMRTLTSLTGLADVNNPTKMQMPEKRKGEGEGQNQGEVIGEVIGVDKWTRGTGKMLGGFTFPIVGQEEPEDLAIAGEKLNDSHQSDDKAAGKQQDEK